LRALAIQGLVFTTSAGITSNCNPKVASSSLRRGEAERESVFGLSHGDGSGRVSATKDSFKAISNRAAARRRSPAAFWVHVAASVSEWSVAAAFDEAVLRALLRQHQPLFRGSERRHARVAASVSPSLCSGPELPAVSLSNRRTASVPTVLASASSESSAV